MIGDSNGAGTGECLDVCVIGDSNGGGTGECLDVWLVIVMALVSVWMCDW